MSGMFDTKIDKAKRKQELSEKEQKAKRKSRIISISVISVFLLVVAIAIFLNSNWIRRNITVVTIDGVNFNTAQYEYFFNSEYLNYYNFYDQQGFGFIVPERSMLSRQMYDESINQTWADLIGERTLERMRDMTAINIAAAADSRYELPQEIYDEIDNIILGQEFQAMMNGFPSVEMYLQAVHGTSINLPIYRDILQFAYTADNYTMFVRDTFEFTDDELDIYYDENSDLFDTFIYRAFLLNADYPGEDAEDFDAEREANINSVRETARGYESAIITEDDFIQAAFEYDMFNYGLPESTLREIQGEQLDNGEYLDYNFAEWLRDSGRASGDITAIDMPDGAAVVFFLSRDKNDYRTVGMQQILISPENVSADDFPDGVFDPLYVEAIEAANDDMRERALLVESLFIEAGSTQEALINLREEYSDYDGSEDGLFEDIARINYQGIAVSTMKVVPELEQWLFDNRSVGDSALIRTEYGYHFVYFTGYGDLFSRLMADDRLRSEKIEEWFESLDFGEPVKTGAFILVSS